MSEDDAAPPPTLRFFYIKAGNFTSIHVDGAIGSLTPNGKLHVAFFVERPAIPTQIDFEVKEERELGKELSRVGRDGIVRELQMDAFMDLDTARKIHDWFGRNIKILETVLKEKEETVPETAQSIPSGGPH